jgi:hypothetical protein
MYGLPYGIDPNKTNTGVKIICQSDGSSAQSRESSEMHALHTLHAIA